MDLAGNVPLILGMEGFDKNMNGGKQCVHGLIELIAISRRVTALELVSEPPIPWTMSLQPVAKVTSQTEIVSRA